VKIYIALIIVLLGITASTNVGAVEPVYVKRKQELTGEYEKVAAPEIPPKIIFKKDPKYPIKFINTDIEGKVKVFFVIDAQGVPVQVQYIEATDLAFAQEAEDAVKEWRFKPALKSGLAVPSCVVAPITFSSKSSAQTKQALVERFLNAVDFVAGVKQGTLVTSKQAGLTTPLIDFVANAPIPHLQSYIAEVFSRHLSLAHVLAAIEFYESSTGRYIISIQKSQPKSQRIPLILSTEQAMVYNAFVETGAEEAFEKIVNDRRVWDEVIIELENKSATQFL